MAIFVVVGQVCHHFVDIEILVQMAADDLISTNAGSYPFRRGADPVVTTRPFVSGRGSFLSSI